MPKYKVELVTPEHDLEDIQHLLVCAQADVDYLEIDLAPNSLMPALEEFIFSDISECALFVLYCSGRPVGILAAVVNTHPIFTNSKAVSEWFWYVLPEHRFQKASLMLVKAYEHWAVKIGARFVSMSHFHDETGNRLSKIYTRMGYKPIEHSYYKELK